MLKSDVKRTKIRAKMGRSQPKETFMKSRFLQKTNFAMHPLILSSFFAFAFTFVPSNSANAQLRPSDKLTPKNADVFAELLERDWKEKPEWAEMLGTLLKGQPIGANTGWFKSSESRIGWDWLQKQFDKNGDEKVSQSEATTFKKVFGAIDRNSDGGITKVDFNWDDVSHVNPQKPSEKIFYSLDRDSNGRIDQNEMAQLMKAIDNDNKGYLTPDDFAGAFAEFDNPSKKRPAQTQRRADPNAMLNMFFNGELGNLTDGPKLGATAPDFELSLLKTEGSMKLSSFKGKKIVVLNFGSFT